MTRALPPGVRRHGVGWEVSVYVAGAGRSYEPFPLDTPLEAMQQWRRAERARLELKIHRRGPNRPAAGTFAADAATYLRTVRALPSIAMRRTDIAQWVALFGTRRRDAISADEIRAQRDTWLLHGPKRMIRKATRDPKTRRVTSPAYFVEIDAPLAASTVNHRLRALSNLWTVLDGPSAYNPVREVPEAEEGDGEPRGIPHSVIEEILAKMPDRGRPTGGARTNVSLTKIRLKVIAYTGLAHAQLMQLRRIHVDFNEGTMRAPGRRKGRGSPARRVPLLPQAVAALRELDQADGWGPFSPSSMRASFLRACAKAGLPNAKLRPYDLRHSLLTLIATVTRDERAVQEIAGHGDIRTTRRYTENSLSPRLQSVSAALQTALKESELPK